MRIGCHYCGLTCRVVYGINMLGAIEGYFEGLAPVARGRRSVVDVDVVLGCYGKAVRS